MAKNRVIGKNGDLPWHNKEEFKHFKNTTYGFPMIMGRKTFDSLQVPLKGRLHIIISRNLQLNYEFEEVKIFHSLTEAFEFCREKKFEKIFIIGGGEIYKQTIDSADELLISVMDMEAEGDTMFPEIDMNKWMIEENEKREGFEIIRYKKRENGSEN
jgi:dihydrofolate reductase